MMSLLLAAALAAAPPATNALRSFDDWVVGCDNGRACTAMAYAPKDEDGGANLSIGRSAAPGAVPEIVVNPLDEEATFGDLSIDGRRAHLRLKRWTNGSNLVTIAPDQSFALARALRDARQARLIGPDGKDLGPLPVKGAAAALLFMDDAQKRVGTVGALARPGAKANATVPPPPLLPVVVAAAPSARAPARIDRAFTARLMRAEKCDVEQDSDHVSMDRLDSRHSLLLVRLDCISGAYNILYRAFVVADGGRPVEARFDPFPNFVDEAAGQPIYNLSWDPKERRLFAGFKARGLGDCGLWYDYAWDGARFRLVEASAMDDCRMAFDTIRIFRARVVTR